MNALIKFNTFALLAFILGAGSACTPPPVSDDDDDDSGSVGDDDDATGDDDDATGDDDDATGDDDDATGDDDDDDSDHQQPPTHEEFEALAIDARESMLQTFTRDVDDLLYIEGDQGSTLSFPYHGSLIHLDGSPVTGDVDIELLEIFDKGSMLVTDMSPVGRNPAGEIAQLISGGEHFVNATQEGEQLQLAAGFMLTAPVAGTGEEPDGMALFRDEDADHGGALEDDVVWDEEEQNPDGFAVMGEGDPTENGEGVATGYWAFSSQFGWTNIDRWYSDPSPKTTIHVDVPDGWDDTNCAVYLSYDGEETALASFDTYDADAELFSEHYGLIPIGLEVHVVLVTENEGLWSYIIQAATIEEDHLTVFPSAGDFIDTDMEGLTAVINALP
jgi:hypothetical protein